MIRQTPSDSISPEKKKPKGENDRIVLVLLELLKKEQPDVKFLYFAKPGIYHPSKKSVGEGEYAGFRRRSIVLKVGDERIAVSNVIGTYDRRAYCKYFTVGKYDPKKKRCTVNEVMTVKGESIIHEDHPDVVDGVLKQMTEAHNLRKSFVKVFGKKEEKSDAEKTLQGLTETNKPPLEWLRDWNEKRRSILFPLLPERQIMDLHDDGPGYDQTGIQMEMRHDGVEPKPATVPQSTPKKEEESFDDDQTFFDDPKYSDVFDGLF